MAQHGSVDRPRQPAIGRADRTRLPVLVERQVRPPCEGASLIPLVVLCIVVAGGAIFVLGSQFGGLWDAVRGQTGTDVAVEAITLRDVHDGRRMPTTCWTQQPIRINVLVRSYGAGLAARESGLRVTLTARPTDRPDAAPLVFQSNGAPLQATGGRGALDVPFLVTLPVHLRDQRLTWTASISVPDDQYAANDTLSDVVFGPCA